MKTKDVILVIALFGGVPFAMIVGGFGGIAIGTFLFGGLL